MDDDDADDDLQRALELSREFTQVTQPALPETPSAAVAVLGRFPSKFRCYAAAAAGRGDLDNTGRILLPTSCLRLFVSFLGELPPTLLLRLVGGDGSECCVGVAEFIEDDVASRMLVKAGGAMVREDDGCVRMWETSTGDDAILKGRWKGRDDGRRKRKGGSRRDNRRDDD